MCLGQPPPSFLATMEEYIKEAPQTSSVQNRLVSDNLEMLLCIMIFIFLLTLIKYVLLKEYEQREESPPPAEEVEEKETEKEEENNKPLQEAAAAEEEETQAKEEVKEPQPLVSLDSTDDLLVCFTKYISHQILLHKLIIGPSGSN